MTNPTTEAAPHRHYPECASTNDIAREWARNVDGPAPEGAYVTADFQTAGRGRRGRTWLSVPGENLLLSIILRPPYPVSESWKLGFVAALAVSDAVAEYNVSPFLKWPNDVLVEGRKLSGVLIETVIDPVDPARWAAIVGVGVNVNQPAFTSEDSYDIRPISLRIATGQEVAVDQVGAAVQRHLLVRERDHRARGFAAVAATWRERMASGYEIKRGAERGVQTDLTDDGQVRVRLADGTFTLWGTVDA